MGAVSLAVGVRRPPHVVVSRAAARTDSLAQNLIKANASYDKAALQAAKAERAKVVWPHPLAPLRRFEEGVYQVSSRVVSAKLEGAAMAALRLAAAVYVSVAQTATLPLSQPPSIKEEADRKAVGAKQPKDDGRRVAVTSGVEVDV